MWSSNIWEKGDESCLDWWSIPDTTDHSSAVALNNHRVKFGEFWTDSSVNFVRAVSELFGDIKLGKSVKSNKY